MLLNFTCCSLNSSSYIFFSIAGISSFGFICSSPQNNDQQFFCYQFLVLGFSCMSVVHFLNLYVLLVLNAVSRDCLGSIWFSISASNNLDWFQLTPINSSTFTSSLWLICSKLSRKYFHFFIFSWVTILLSSTGRSRPWDIDPLSI